jgi:hypothetical protein
LSRIFYLEGSGVASSGPVPSPPSSPPRHPCRDLFTVVPSSFLLCHFPFLPYLKRKTSFCADGDMRAVCCLPSVGEMGRKIPFRSGSPNCVLIFRSGR